MKAADHDILLQEGEGVMIEYKKRVSASLTREITAFANTAGGRILLGVRAQAHDGAHDQAYDKAPTVHVPHKLEGKIQDKTQGKLRPGYCLSAAEIIEFKTPEQG